MKILVVDDEPIIANWMADTLDYYGHHVLPLYSSGEALDHLFEIQFDLALICITLPTVPGDKLGYLFRDDVIQPGCRVILFDRWDVVADMKARRPDFECRVLPLKHEELARMVENAEGQASLTG